MLKERHAYIEAVFEIVDQALSYRKDNETQWWKRWLPWSCRKQGLT